MCLSMKQQLHLVLHALSTAAAETPQLRRPRADESVLTNAQLENNIGKERKIKIKITSTMIIV